MYPVGTYNRSQTAFHRPVFSTFLTKPTNFDQKLARRYTEGESDRGKMKQYKVSNYNQPHLISKRRKVVHRGSPTKGSQLRCHVKILSPQIYAARTVGNITTMVPSINNTRDNKVSVTAAPCHTNLGQSLHVIWHSSN